jgi:hypothetical protein
MSALERFLVLTEDTGEGAVEVPSRFLAMLLNRMAPGRITPDVQRKWEPATPEARKIAGFNAWVSRRQDLASFRRYLASNLSKEHGFVVWHVDADTPYGNREEFGKKVAKFDKLIRQPVRVLLEREVGSEEANRRLEKLLLFVPSYSIEAWCFQHTKLASTYCDCRKDCHAKLASWADERGQLDEIRQPKQELCFGSKYNVELAGPGYPLQVVLAAEKSLHDTLKMLRDCAPLVAALEQARPAWEQ